MRRLSFALASLVVPLALYACGDDDGSPPTSNDGAAPAQESSAAPDTSVDAGRDQGSPDALRCTQAELDAPCGDGGGDCTASARIEVLFPLGAAPAQYEPSCVKVKVGAVINFAGSFFQHPLEPLGGDTPTPIPLQETDPPVGASGRPELALTMSSAGTFGYQCVFHPTTMFGVIQVVP
ncbi:MAG: hypothetical protein KF819_39295 [Labilithrix sp.]|nr:hypothetical protein [Labilithrix sp.]